MEELVLRRPQTGWALSDAAAAGGNSDEAQGHRRGAQDCDGRHPRDRLRREGQLIGQEILDHLGYRDACCGRCSRAGSSRSTSVRPLKRMWRWRSLYEAAVARQQADQIFNFSLTRTATKTLLTPGVRGVIGSVGSDANAGHRLPARTGNPQLPAEDYFEVVATATVATAASRCVMRLRPSCD